MLRSTCRLASAARLLVALTSASRGHAVEIPWETPAKAPAPLAAGATPPRPWPKDAFVPVTEARIVALPANERRAWEAYWAESKRRTAQLPTRDLVDRSATHPLPGGPIGSSYSKGVNLHADASYYASAAARTVADHVVNWQTVVGGWVKSGDYFRDRKPKDDHHDAWSAGTFDNDSTIYELRFLAKVATAAGDDPRAKSWRSAFQRGFEYVLAAQYPNGGFPQVYPLVGWYHDAITFNDDAMVHILEFLRDVSGRTGEFTFVDPAQAALANAALARGIACVLATQMKTPSGRLIVWGQQHDPINLQPCAARNFEPVSACSHESAGLTQFLMSLPEPNSAIITAVDAAMAWFAGAGWANLRWDRSATTGTGLLTSERPTTLWARFYELDTARPVFGERDRTCHYAVTELSDERRLGYGWFNERATALDAKYAAWKNARIAR